MLLTTTLLHARENYAEAKCVAARRVHLVGVVHVLFTLIG